MHNSFRYGFEKKADAGTALALLGTAGLIGGLGAFTGHAAHVGKKMIHARQGEDYTPETFIERHPYATGAATLGWAPAMSLMSSQQELDRENPKTRAIMKEHPIMYAGV